MRIGELFENEDEPARIKLGAGNAAAQAWIEKVYARYPQTFQNNHVMPLGGSGDEQQFAMFELVPSFSKRGAVEVKWFQAYPLRSGVGSRAMKELQALAREDGISLTLFPWDKGQVSQSKLTKFYRGQGFAPTVKGGKAMQWTPDHPGVAEGSEQISEYRDRLLQYVKSLLPNYPEYVLKDWLVPNKGDFSNLPDTDLKNGIMEKLKLAGLTPNTIWQLVPNMQFTMDMFEPMTKQRLVGRAGGNSDMGLDVPRDKERHATQAALAQQQGGVRKEPVLLIKTDKGYELLEGWHRTIQHFAKYPNGYTGPAYVAVAQGQQGVAEAETATQNSRQLAKEFRQLGYSQIGSGADATVWAKDDSHVIKILMPEDVGSRAEQIFRKFYEFSIAHQDLASVPRFNEVNTIDINGKDYTQIEMERLAPIEPDTFMEGIVWLLSDYVAEQTPWPTIESELAMPSTWEIYNPNYANTLAKTWQSLLENPAGRKTYAMYRQLYNVMKLLFTTGTINKFGWDLHTANVMRRNNGQPVIIDPWFSSGTS
jgi:hypothetical protein